MNPSAQIADAASTAADAEVAAEGSRWLRRLFDHE